MQYFNLGVKEGVDISCLHSLLFQAWLKAAKIYNKRSLICTLTSSNEYVLGRSKNSLHYVKPFCRAIDLRTRRIPYNIQEELVIQIEEELQKLDPHFQVILKPDHIHIELDYRS